MYIYIYMRVRIRILHAEPCINDTHNQEFRFCRKHMDLSCKQYIKVTF